MAKNLVVGEQVFVPISKLKAERQAPSALLKGVILEVPAPGAAERRVKIDIGRGESEWVVNSNCHRNIGLLVICLGDFESEASLLDPLAKSVLQFCRLLAADDFVRMIKVRSKAELQIVWDREQSAYSHVIIIGHGTGEKIKFAVDGWVGPNDLGDVLDAKGHQAKTVISLVCRSRKAGFGKWFSTSDAVGQFIAPFHEVHGAVASQFVQMFLAYHLLEGETVKVAFNHARASVPGGTSFRLWRKGILA